MKLDKLLEPGRIGPMVLRNRLVFPAIQNRGADKDGHATARMAEYFATRARGGVGLVTVQHSFCWPAAKLERGLALWDDEFIPDLAAAVGAVHKEGAKISIQLGGRGTQLGPGVQSVAPSSIRLSYENGIPRELTVEEIEGFVQAYAEAARRVAQAGFDAIEIHGAHGKLIAQFLSPYTNRRSDDYGGSPEKRTFFPRQIVAAVRQAVGPDLGIIFRLSLTEKFEGGLSIEEGLEHIRLLDEAGVDAFHVSGGGQEHVWNTDHSFFFPRMCQAELAEAARKVTAKPIIAVGKIQDLAQAEQILEQGQADFVAMGRPFLADPDLLKKWLAGRQSEVRRCLYCLNCSTWPSRPYLKERGIGCTVNPATMRELEFTIKPAASPKRILVAGGGLAGMEAARTLALRGHKVILHEASDQLGGQWKVASAGEHKADFKTIIPWLRRGMEQAGVEIHLGSFVDMELVRSVNPDVVVVATGAVPRTLTSDLINGSSLPVLQGVDIISGKSAASGKRVVVVGGRYIGMEVAACLADQGKHVSLVEAAGLGHGTIPRLRGVYRNRLVERNVFIFDYSPLLRLTDKCVDIAHCGSMLSLPCDCVVLAIGTVPQRDLALQLDSAGVPYEIIGDADGIGDALKSISDGAEIGRML